MNRARLEMLHHMLTEDMPREVVAFYMPTWQTKSSTLALITDEPDPRYLPVTLKEGDCGTAACAFGSAALYGPFREMGLRFDETYGWPTFAGKISMPAAEEFFDISEKEAEYLFGPASYPKQPITPLIVAARVRELIDKEKAK